MKDYLKSCGKTFLFFYGFMGILVGLQGCAQWSAMTPKEKQLTVGIAIATAVLGAAAAHNSSDDTVIQIMPATVPDHTHEWPTPPKCSHPSHC